MLPFGINLIDIIIAVIAVFFMVDGYRKGFFSEAFGLLGFAVGLGLALVTYRAVGDFASFQFGLSRAMAKTFAFILIWALMESFLPFAVGRLFQKMPLSWLRSKWNNRIGLLPGLIQGLALMAVLLSIVSAVALPTVFKRTVFLSRFGSSLMRMVTAAESAVADMYAGPVWETLGFTAASDDSVSLDLGFTTDQSFPDPASERRMYDMVNAERVSRGLKPLVLDQAMTEAAREHGADMLERGYFSHMSPEGGNAATRVNAVGVKFREVGENLAMSPDTTIAHEGLMRSDRHRTNILSPQFTRIGIGIRNAGPHGMIFVQVFAD